MNKEYKELIADYVAGEPVSDVLLAACRENPDLLKALAQHVSLDRLIHAQAIAGDEETFTAEVMMRLKARQDDTLSNKIRQQLEGEQRRKRFLFTPLATMVAVAACLVISFTIYFQSVSSKQNLAQLSASTGAVWEGGAKTLGDSIGKGILQLTHGYSEIEMYNGVSLLLEAPVKIEIKSLGLIRLMSGRIVAKVPEQAIGFTVLTPSSEVVDLGTEFGMSVGADGASEVHVLDGEVKARTLKEKEFKHLVVNEAMTFKDSQPGMKIASQPEIFLRTLPGRSSDKPEYLHWPCDDNGSHTLSCNGTGIGGEFFPGTLKSLEGGELPRYENGQIGQALYFNGVNSYVETDFLGIEGNKPRTVAFWTKVPDATNANLAYGMLGWGRMSPAAAWQISSNPNIKEGPIGRLRVGTYNSYVIGTTDLRDNRWHHVAVVMYGGEYADVSTHILLYIDGELEKTSRKSIARIKTQLNHASSKPFGIGQNLGFRDRQKPAKNAYFKGWMDEIYVFDTALDINQIRSLVDYNKL